MKQYFRLFYSAASFFAVILLIIFILFGSRLSWWRSLDDAWLDMLSRTQARQEALSKDVALVLIDETSLQAMSEHYHQRWPWSRDVFAGLFAAIHQAGAKQIVVDLLFLEHSEDAYLDELLGAYAAACQSTILADQPHKRPVIWPESASYWSKYNLSQRMGSTDYKPDSDGVIRHYDVENSLAQISLNRLGTFSFPSSILLHWYGGLKSLPHSKRLSAAPLILEGYGPNGILSKIKATGVDELNPEAIARALTGLEKNHFGDVLKDKIVFVGTNAAATSDTKATPVGRLEPGVLAHLTAWSNLYDGTWLHTFPSIARLRGEEILALAMTLLLVGIGWQQNRLRWVMAMHVGTILFLLTGCVFLFQKGWYLPPITPFMAIVGSFGFMATHHWFTEGKRKRQIQNLFNSYVAKEVLDEFIRDPEKLHLGGTKKEITIFFSDLQGFTDMSEALTPEKLVEIINHYLSEMSPVILEYGGYLDKYIGDAIMGIFGAPHLLPDHALSCCEAALASRDKLVELNQDFQKQYGFTLYARIGINTGEAIVGNIGSQRKINYTALGDSVNLASRLEGANKEFGTTILMGEATHRLVADRVLARPVELLQVKGKKQPIQTYELLSILNGASANLIEQVKVFNEAYQLYRVKNFVDALELFQRFLALYPEDQLASIYMQRCQEFLKKPPPSDWNGVYTMKTK